MMKQAVILAAGAGTRIRAVANGTPKCLLPVGGVPLIEHQLRVLRQVGIDRVCVLVGYAADRVEALVGGACECIRNERFADTNSLYSLLLARRWVSGPFVLLNSDVFAHPDIYHRVLAVGGSALAYDSSTGVGDAPGEPQWLDDPRFKDDDDRGRHGPIISERMARWCAERGTDEIIAILGDAMIPCAPVLSPQQSTKSSIRSAPSTTPRPPSTAQITTRPSAASTCPWWSRWKPTASAACSSARRTAALR